MLRRQFTRLEGLILELDEKVHSYKKLAAEANVKETEYRGLLKLYQEKNKKLRAETDSIRRQAVQEAEALLKDSNAAVERAIRSIRESDAEKQVIKQVREQIAEQKEKVAKLHVKAETSAPQESGGPVREGDYVRWSETGATGYVVSKADKKGRIMVQYDSGIKMQTPSNLLEKIKKKKSRGFVRFKPKSDKTFSREIDLRGMMSEEALELLDPFFDEAILTGLHQVSIVHGKGTGKLRKSVAAYLKGHPHVQDYRLGYWNEGDSGVTVAYLVGHEKEQEPDGESI